VCNAQELELQKQKDLLKRWRLEEGCNEVEEFQQQKAIVPFAGKDSRKDGAPTWIEDLLANKVQQS